MLQFSFTMLPASSPCRKITPP